MQNFNREICIVEREHVRYLGRDKKIILKCVFQKLSVKLQITFSGNKVEQMSSTPTGSLHDFSQFFQAVYNSYFKMFQDCFLARHLEVAVADDTISRTCS